MLVVGLGERLHGDTPFWRKGDKSPGLDRDQLNVWQSGYRYTEWWLAAISRGPDGQGHMFRGQGDQGAFRGVSA